MDSKHPCWCSHQVSVHGNTIYQGCQRLSCPQVKVSVLFRSSSLHLCHHVSIQSIPTADDALLLSGLFFPTSQTLERWFPSLAHAAHEMLSLHISTNCCLFSGQRHASFC